MIGTVKDQMLEQTFALYFYRLGNYKGFKLWLEQILCKIYILIISGTSHCVFIFSNHKSSYNLCLLL